MCMSDMVQEKRFRLRWFSNGTCKVCMLSDIIHSSVFPHSITRKGHWIVVSVSAGWRNIV